MLNQCQPSVPHIPLCPPLTGAESGRGGSLPCVSPPGRPVSSLPPASLGCWHTAPCVTAGCPGCWCFPPCQGAVSWHCRKRCAPAGTTSIHGCPHSHPVPPSPHANHPLVESTDEDLDLTEVRALSWLLRPAAFHQHCQLLTVHPNVDGGSEEGLLAVTHLLHDLCQGVANSEHQTSMVGQDLHTRAPHPHL